MASLKAAHQRVVDKMATDLELQTAHWNAEKEKLEFLLQAEKEKVELLREAERKELEVERKERHRERAESKQVLRGVLEDETKLSRELVNHEKLAANYEKLISKLFDHFGRENSEEAERSTRKRVTRKIHVANMKRTKPGVPSSEKRKSGQSKPRHSPTADGGQWIDIDGAEKIQVSRTPTQVESEAKTARWRILRGAGDTSTNQEHILRGNSTNSGRAEADSNVTTIGGTNAVAGGGIRRRKSVITFMDLAGDQ